MPGTVFCLSPFSNIKKAYLRISKYLAQFFAYPLFQILKKYTYESQNTLLILIIITLKETIYIKTIIQIDKHKAKYIITACIPIIIIKKFLLFFFTVYKNERKKHKFKQWKNQKKQLLQQKQKKYLT